MRAGVDEITGGMVGGERLKGSFVRARGDI